MNIESIPEVYTLIAENDDAELRQKFLNNVNFREYEKYIDSIVYVPNRWKSNMAVHTTRIRIFNRHRKGEKSQIRVFPPAFTTHRTLDDFLGTLIYHEGYHAREVCEVPELIIPTMAEIFVESLKEIKFNPWSFLFGPRYFSPRAAAAEIRAIRNELENSPFNKPLYGRRMELEMALDHCSKFVKSFPHVEPLPAL